MGCSYCINFDFSIKQTSLYYWLTDHLCALHNYAMVAMLFSIVTIIELYLPAKTYIKGIYCITSFSQAITKFI